jgi:hypothetical protein
MLPGTHIDSIQEVVRGSSGYLPPRGIVLISIC